MGSDAGAEVDAGVQQMVAGPRRTVFGTPESHEEMLEKFRSLEGRFVKAREMVCDH